MRNRAKFSARTLRPLDSHIAPIVRPVYADHTVREGDRKGHWCVCTVYSTDSNRTQQQMAREAIILDVSETGARIRFRSKSRLPKTLFLKASRLGLRRYARVIWQDEFDAGIVFVSRPPVISAAE